MNLIKELARQLDYLDGKFPSVVFFSKIIVPILLLYPASILAHWIHRFHVIEGSGAFVVVAGVILGGAIVGMVIGTPRFEKLLGKRIHRRVVRAIVGALIASLGAVVLLLIYAWMVGVSNMTDL